MPKDPVPLDQLQRRQRPRDRGGQEPAAGWEDRFFEALRLTQLPAEAAKAAGVSRSFVYKVRARNPEFAERWAEEIERTTELLEAVAVKRAVESSDTMLIFMLKSRRPDVYRENVHHQHQVEGSLTFQLDGQQPIQLDGPKRREAARLLQESADAEVIEGTAVEEGNVEP